MVHGMPLAVLLGHGDARLVGLAQGAGIDPRHLCLVGVRSFEAEESALLAGLGVRIIQMAEIDSRGLVATLREAIEIASGAPGGWGVSIDLDVLDPLDAPGVGSPVAHGLEPQELIDAIAGIAMTPGFLGAEMSEYNPELDPEGTTGRVAEALLVSIFSN
jgi:arginase